MSLTENPSFTVIYVAREAGDFPVKSYAFFKAEDEARTFYAKQFNPIVLRRFHPVDQEHVRSLDSPEAGCISLRLAPPKCRKCFGSGRLAEDFFAVQRTPCDICGGGGVEYRH